MISTSNDGSRSGSRTRRALAALVVPFAMVAVATTDASGDVVLKLGDILIAEPTNSAISVIDPVTGTKTVISAGGLLSPVGKTVGVAMALDGDIIVVHRSTGLIRVNPLTGSQSILSTGGLFRDPWAIAVNKDTGAIYVADSGYDNDRPSINEAGKIIRVDPGSGLQELIASGTPCTLFPSNAACQNTTSPGSYLAHPYGIAIDYAAFPGTLVVADMGAFNGKGAVVRLQPVPNGTQTLLWGPASAVPAPQVPQLSPLGCPMGIVVEPNGNLLTTVFTYPVPFSPSVPPPDGTFYGCAPPGIFRIDLVNNTQTVLNANAPAWQANHPYAVGDVILDDLAGPGHVHKVVTAGVSHDFTPNWNGSLQGVTTDGTVVWQNIGLGADWRIPFGVDTEPAPTQSDPLQYNVIVGDEGYSMLFRLDRSGDFIPSPTPLASDLANVTSVDVIDFTPLGGFNGPPTRFSAQPVGIQPWGTTQVILSLTTSEAATCRYSSQPGVAYASMPHTFATTGATAHATPVNGLTNGGSYVFYVRCVDSAGNPNLNDLVIAFSIAAESTTTTSNFAGTEAPLGENGMWDSPGAWSDLQKNNGAVAVSVNSMGRLVTPLVAPDQYAEITYDQDPGAASWVGVTTRVQSATNGSGYLAIVYAGEVRLYRTDDSGALNFTLQALASVSTGTLPRRLRLESQGNTHRVYFNGVQAISYTTSGTAYATGQPGIAASVFGGPQVRILTFTTGPIDTADTMPPDRSNGQPAGTLPAGTMQATLSLATGEPATCRYSPQTGVAFASMTSTFAATGATAHATTVTGLVDATSYAFYVRCVDALGNVNTDDFTVTFAVADPSTTTSTFADTEAPLSENGRWDSPGTWNDLRKNNGAYAPGLDAMARLATPTLAADQYAEVTYDQDPGTASWLGVATRVQGPADGSGYLAIVYAGEVRFYRTDDVGTLQFTFLGAAPAAVGTAPRRLRLESHGNTHRVYFNGTEVISHIASGLVYGTGQPGIAASMWGGPQVRILTFVAGSLDVPDTVPPTRVNGQPAGTLPAGTTQTTLSLATGEPATCRYSPQAGVAFASMASTFATTGATAQATTVTGLVDATSYAFYVRCVDALGNVNIDDFTVTFAVADPSTTTSTFAGTEAPLSENGRWDSPGAWNDMRKNNGAYAPGVDAMARLATPTLAADQYAEVTYDQDPGTASWLGVATRVQGPADGSGYLAIVYAGEVRLYRTDDVGTLQFTFLGAAPAAVGTAPRRLRLESHGNTHRVYFNGTEAISHIASGLVYATGQPGIAASVFGGPQVRILTFEAGNVAPGS